MAGHLSHAQQIRIRFLSWTLFYFYTFFLLECLLASDPEILLVVKLNDKLLHAGAFCVYFLICAIAFSQSKKGWLASRSEGLAFLWAGFIGLITEVLQIFVPRRTADVLDFLTAVIGMLAGIPFYRFGKKLIKKHYDE